MSQKTLIIIDMTNDFVQPGASLEVPDNRKYTAYDLVSRGYKVTVPKNCVAGLNKEDHEFALRQMEKILKVNIV